MAVHREQAIPILDQRQRASPERASTEAGMRKFPYRPRLILEGVGQIPGGAIKLCKLQSKESSTSILSEEKQSRSGDNGKIGE